MAEKEAVDLIAHVQALEAKVTGYCRANILEAESKQKDDFIAKVSSRVTQLEEMAHLAIERLMSSALVMD